MHNCVDTERWFKTQGTFLKKRCSAYGGQQNTSPGVWRKACKKSTDQREVNTLRITFCQLLCIAWDDARRKLEGQCKRSLLPTAFNVHGFVEDQENDECASLSSLSTNSGADRLNLEKHLDKLGNSKRGRLQSVEHRNILGATARLEMLFPLPCMRWIKSAVRHNCVFHQAMQTYPQSFERLERYSTQFTVELLFSALRIVKSDLRASTKEDLVEVLYFNPLSQNSKSHNLTSHNSSSYNSIWHNIDSFCATQFSLTFSQCNFPYVTTSHLLKSDYLFICVG